eukprot:m.37808 g.37808  ORF g.37808 m.37808 type:complete len:214 (+) comp32446_c0_seq2:48-689(+)
MRSESPSCCFPVIPHFPYEDSLEETFLEMSAWFYNSVDQPRLKIAVTRSAVLSSPRFRRELENASRTSGVEGVRSVEDGWQLVELFAEKGPGGVQHLCKHLEEFKPIDYNLVNILRGALRTPLKKQLESSPKAGFSRSISASEENVSARYQELAALSMAVDKLPRQIDFTRSLPSLLDCTDELFTRIRKLLHHSEHCAFKQANSATFLVIQFV